jgi:hypothetical protein
MTRYDVSEMLPLERSRLKHRLSEEGIEFSIVGFVLSIDHTDEAQTDQVLLEVEEFGLRLRDEFSRDARAREGDVRALSCEVCGESPAAEINLRRMVGLVVIAETFNYSAILCNPCADAATSSAQQQTAIKGWTSISSAAMNPFVIAANARSRRNHRRKLQGEK